MIKQNNQELEDGPGLEKNRESCAVFLLLFAWLGGEFEYLFTRPYRYFVLKVY